MAKVSTYLNFNGKTEEAFNYYKAIFGTDFQGPMMRFGDVPPQEGMPPMSETSKQLIMHVALPTIGDHLLMGTDAIEEMGFKLVVGNNVYVCLHPDSRKEADRLFKALSEGGKVEMPLQEQFWGDYYGSWSDKYGVNWMINTDARL